MNPDNISAASSFKASWDSLVQLMSNLGASAVDFMVVIQAFAYLSGIFFLGRGILLMTRGPGGVRRDNTSLFGWFWSMAIGVLLFALPETLSVLGSTFLPDANTNPLAYSAYIQGQGLGVGSCKLGGLRPLFVVFGFIAVIRGLFVFREVGMYGQAARGNATVSRGFILCIAGVLLVHMQETLALINQVTGLNMGAGLC
jgi:hypothetical protein